MNPTALRSSLLALPVLLAASGCATLEDFTLKQSLEPQLTELQGLRAGLEEDWAGIGALVSSVEQQVATFAASPIDASAFDTPAIRNAIVEAFDAGLQEGSPMTGAMDANEELEAALAGAEDETRSSVGEFYAKSSALYDTLQVSLPAAIQSSLKNAAAAGVTAAQAKLLAEKKIAAGEQNPLMTEADQAALEEEQRALDREAESLEQLTEKIAVEAQGYSGRLSAAYAKFQAQVASLQTEE